MELMTHLERLAAEHAIDFVGAADIAPYHQELTDVGGDVIAVFPRAVSIGIRLPDAIVDLLPSNTYESALLYETHAYSVINTRLDAFSSIVASVLQQYGHRAMPLPAAERIDSERVCASASHKFISRLAGHGWIGKSCLLVTPQFGPRVRWTSVLTDAPLPANDPILESQCGECDVCVTACPPGAFTGRVFREDEPREARYDVHKCEAYLLSRRETLGQAVCGLCLYSCPYGQKG